MKKLSIILMFFIFFLTVNFINANEIVNQAQILYDNGKYQEAVQAISSNKGAISLDTDKWQADNIEGWGYYQLGQLDTAYSTFQSMANNPNHRYHINGIFMLGQIEEKRGNYTNACQDYLRIVKDYPNSNSFTESNFNLGLSFMKLSKEEKEKLSLIEYKNIADALYLAGWTYQDKKKDYPKAEMVLDYLVGNFSNYENWDDAVMLLGRARIKLGTLDEALKTFKILFDKTAYNNHWNEAQAEIVRILVDQGKWEDVKKEAIELFNYPHLRGRAYAVMSYVNACISLDNKEEAIDFLETIINDYPGDPYIEYYKERLKVVKVGCCVE